MKWIESDKVIEPSLKLGIPLSSICEVTFEAESKTVRSLLKGFSGWETFVDEACKAAALNGVVQANGALICYYLRCDATPAH